MDADVPGLAGILKSIGLGPMGLEKIQFGIGVVGKMTTGLIAILSLLLILAILGLVTQHMELTYVCVGLGVGAYLFSQLSIMRFASKNPAVAVLEGAQFVRYHQIDMAAKGLLSPSSQPNIEPPLIEGKKMDEPDSDPV